MKLYSFPIAPNPTKVCLYLAEKREAGTVIPIQEVAVSLIEGEQKSPEHLQRNPLGKLPVLELEDGTILTESLAIIEYLEERFPEPPMIGRDPESRAQARRLERIADFGVLMPVGMYVHATRSPLGLEPDLAVAKHAEGRLPANLRLLDDALSDGRLFLTGELPAIADCTLAAALQFGRFGGWELPTEFTNICEWQERYRSRPAAQSVLVT